MFRISNNDGKTFTEPKPIPIDPYPSYTGTNNDRMIQLRSGRIVLPLWYTPDYRIDKHIRTRVYYSDDEGATWKQSKTLVRYSGQRRRRAGTRSRRTERRTPADVDADG